LANHCLQAYLSHLTNKHPLRFSFIDLVSGEILSSFCTGSYFIAMWLAGSSRVGDSASLPHHRALDTAKQNRLSTCLLNE
jgi:hypothetical protein